jgi:hypothetical protein
MLYDAATAHRTETVALFLFNTCLLLCKKNGNKCDLRVMIRMNDQVKFGATNARKSSAPFKR